MKNLREITSHFGIPLVSAYSGHVTSVNEFIEMTRTLKGREGFVIRFSSGHMLKCKSEEYLQLHKTRELMQWEKDIWALIIDNKQDDAKSFMEDSEKARIDAFAHDLYSGLDKTADRLNWIVIAAKDNFNDSKKRFAIEIVQKHTPDIERGLLFKIWDGLDAKKVVYEYVRSQLGTGSRLESIRCLAGGIIWGAY